MRRLILPIVLALSGCSLTPELVEPAPPVPDTFPVTPSETTSVQASAIGWRTLFRDPRLQRLIETALDNNRDLRLATLNVEAVQAQYRIQRAAVLPGIEATGGGTRQRIAANEDTTPTQSSMVTEQVGVNVGLSAYEVDLFGRVRALSQAALARYLASEEGRRAARISLVAAVADAYLAERLALEQRDLAERTLADWRQSLELARLLRQAQQSGELEVVQAEGQVATAEADLEARNRAVMQARNALRLLLGTEPAPDLPEAMPLERQPVVTQLPAGLPSDLLVRRPDIRQAERLMVAANADIGAARAAFFPRISLTASLGYASPAMSGLFDSPHRVWSFSPKITQPLFQNGRLRAELRLSKVRKSSAVVEYERAIQIAFREVADGLAGRETYARQIEAQARFVESAERRAELSNLRYRSGVENRLELLDAQRQLYAARRTLLDLRRNEFSNAVALYKALGGGLSDEQSAASAVSDRRLR
ncbi:Type I secretion outer membrane outer membrane drug efflux lipoprotein [Alloalcanivorax dieselolei B5]|uniref:Type I secretion outer membrane outer membrane drug efflux lipoprotein n=1 Tax=Alcanivorax dieselolei (strain DSM 16502 / CGMCC 1.3690 / MCCC 1A00001 / B-5) TaxID=930169 RepID=K0CAH3_ALCDB|nr:efflux transporter outer membrane subunit [Alloalcanivorax dieselolei]AFT69500.1 Type I secretion outer membrane outer membrane drug efflux lipoprotein [Alloalcanivorax dieselolei B5]GGK10443.1 RND transporter [Alloalcanivorax dieselolei]